MQSNRLKGSFNSFISLHLLLILNSIDSINSKELCSSLLPNNSVRLNKYWFLTKRLRNKRFKRIKLFNSNNKNQELLSESKICSHYYSSHHQVNKQTNLFLTLSNKGTFSIQYSYHVNKINQIKYQSKL